MNYANVSCSNLLINKIRKSNNKNTLHKKIKNFLRKSLFITSNILAVSSISSNAFSSGQVLPRSVTALPNAQALLSTGNGLDRGNIPIGATGLGYFIITDGFILNPGLTNNSPISFADYNGHPQPVSNGNFLLGKQDNYVTSDHPSTINQNIPLAYYSALALNVDNAVHTVVTNNTIGWEDLYNDGDRSYDDVNISYSVQRTEANNSSIIPLDANGYHAIDETMHFNLSIGDVVPSLDNPTIYADTIGHFFVDGNGNPLAGVIDFANARNNINQPATVIPYSGITAFVGGETLQYTQGTTVISDIDNTNIAAVDVSLLPINSIPKIQFNNSASLGSVKNTPGRNDNLLAVTISPNTNLTLTGTSGTFYNGDTARISDYSGLGTIDGYGSVQVSDNTNNVYFTQSIGSNIPVREFVIGQQGSAILGANLIINNQSDSGIKLGNNSTLYINGANIFIDGRIDGAGSIMIGSAPIEANFIHSSNVVFEQVIGGVSKPSSLTLSDDSSLQFSKAASFVGNITLGNNSTGSFADNVTAQNINGTNGSSTVKFINGNPTTIQANLGADNNLNKVIMTNRSVVVTGNFGASEIDFTRPNQVAALKILGNTDLTNTNVTTNSVRRNHDVHISNDQIIKGKWGDKDHLMGGIRLLRDVNVVIDTPYYFGGINPSVNNIGTVELKGDAYSLGRFDGNSLKKVIFSKNATSYGVIRAQTIQVADNVTANFDRGFKIEDEDDNPDIIRPHLMSTGGMTLGSGSKATFASNALLEGAIIAKKPGLGDVYFYNEAEIRSPIGTIQNKMNSVNFIGDSRNAAIKLDKDISANNINLNTVSADIASTMKLNGAVNIHNANLDLNSNILILPNTVATLDGDIAIATTFDGVGGGHIIAQGEGAVLDFSKANTLMITVHGNIQSNEQKSFILFLESQGGQVIQNNRIQVNSNDANRYVYWIYDSKSRRLIGGINPSVIIDDVMNDPTATTDDKVLVQYLKENSNNPTIGAIIHDLGTESEAEAINTVKRLQPTTNNMTNIERESIASVSALVDDRITRIIDSNITESLEGSGVAAGSESMDYGFWFGPFFDRATQRVRSTKSGYKANTYGGTIGYDTKINDLLSIGSALSYAGTDVKYQNSKSGDKTKINSIVLSLYGIREFLNDWFVQGNGYASYGFVKNRETRNNMQANSKYRINSFGAQVLAGYDYRITRSFMATPSIGMRYDRYGQISYTEKDAAPFNYIIKKKATDRLEGIIGGKLTLVKQVKEVLVTPELHGFVNYNILNKTPKLKVNLVDVPAPLPITTIGDSRISYNLGGGIEASRGILEFGVVYDALIQRKYVSHQGTIRVSVSL